MLFFSHKGRCGAKNINWICFAYIIALEKSVLKLRFVLRAAVFLAENTESGKFGLIFRRTQKGLDIFSKNKGSEMRF